MLGQMLLIRPQFDISIVNTFKTFVYILSKINFDPQSIMIKIEKIEAAICCFHFNMILELISVTLKVNPNTLHTLIHITAVISVTNHNLKLIPLSFQRI